jgi:hypothetical protein
MHTSRNEPIVFTSLISDDGKQFLEGDITASDYMGQGQRLAEQQARREVLENYSPGKVVERVGLTAGVAYLVTSILFGADGRLLDALIVLGAGVATMTASALIHLRTHRMPRRPSGRPSDAEDSF